MKPIMIIGLVLILFGIAAYSYQGVVWITTRDTVAKVGPIEVCADREHAIPLFPIVSGVALLAGVALLIGGAVRSRT